MARIVYDIHRNGQEKRHDLQAALRQAMTDFYRRHNTLPVEVVVHKTLVEQAQAALRALDLPKLPVRGSGGCLVPEVWLGWEEGNGRQTG